MFGGLFLTVGFCTFIVGFNHFIYDVSYADRFCFIGICVTLTALGFALLRVLRSQVVLDNEQRAIITSWTFVIELCKTSIPMNEYDVISVNHAVRSNKYRDCSVFPVIITSTKHESICVGILHHVFAARKLAQEISAFTGLPVSDSTLPLTANLLPRDVFAELSEIPAQTPFRTIRQIHLRTAIILMLEAGLALPIILHLIRVRNLYTPLVISSAFVLFYVTAYILDSSTNRPRQ